jgi:N-acetylneuraminate synthase
MTHQVRIGNYVVGSGQPIAIVAEFGINANGYPDLLKAMTDEAHALGIPFVKIQTRINTKGELTDVYTAEELRKPRTVPREVLEHGIRRGVFPEADRQRLLDSNFTSVTTWDQKRTIEFTKEETAEFVRYTKNLGMVGFSSPWCPGAVEVLEEVGVEAYKVASPMATDEEMLTAMARTGKPVILSTGMMDMAMVEAAVETLLRHMREDRLVILHCTSVYGTAPATPGDHGRSMLNLRCIETLKRRFDPIPIGFSANDPGLEPMKMAAALGAVMLEKHVTLLRTMYGSDQASSVEFRELAAPLRVIAEAPDVLGNGQKVFYEAEKEVAKKLRRR